MELLLRREFFRHILACNTHGGNLNQLSSRVLTQPNQIQNSLIIHLFQGIIRRKMLHARRTVNHQFKIIGAQSNNRVSVRNISLNQSDSFTKQFLVRIVEIVHQHALEPFFQRKSLPLSHQAIDDLISIINQILQDMRSKEAVCPGQQDVSGYLRTNLIHTFHAVSAQDLLQRPL